MEEKIISLIKFIELVTEFEKEHKIAFYQLKEIIDKLEKAYPTSRIIEEFVFEKEGV